MARVMYITRANLQVGAPHPAGIQTYRGVLGENSEVPDDIAELLVRRGLAVFVTDKVHIASQPIAEKIPASRTTRKRRG